MPIEPHGPSRSCYSAGVHNFADTDKAEEEGGAMVYGIGFPELLVIYVIAALVLVGIVVAIVRAVRGKKH